MPGMDEWIRFNDERRRVHLTEMCVSRDGEGSLLRLQISPKWMLSFDPGRAEHLGKSSAAEVRINGDPRTVGASSSTAHP